MIYFTGIKVDPWLPEPPVVTADSSGVGIIEIFQMDQMALSNGGYDKIAIELLKQEMLLYSKKQEVAA